MLHIRSARQNHNVFLRHALSTLTYPKLILKTLHSDFLQDEKFHKVALTTYTVISFKIR